MKRHILGLAIFSSIIIAAAFIEAAFFANDNYSYPNELISNYTPAKKTSCSFGRRTRATALPVVRQAFLDYDTKRIDWQVYVPQSDNPVALHLFAKNADGDVHLVATEVMPIRGINQTIKYSSTYMALNNYTPDENLYVVPEMVSPEAVNTMYFDPKFDENTAVPVTVFSARKIYVPLDK